MELDSEDEGSDIGKYATAILWSKFKFILIVKTFRKISFSRSAKICAIPQKSNAMIRLKQPAHTAKF